ncbi:hypothetical protein B296_00029766 [Ensete ventricosum]|uniref:Uncharacterized protein n=1 Tax=Ensete ventricosum TaxID=4639 RepID=A0A427AF12_ENSVE|nr:hypothetical protein B296_00029766 [Ensete ventricosum]
MNMVWVSYFQMTETLDLVIHFYIRTLWMTICFSPIFNMCKPTSSLLSSSCQSSRGG